MAPDESEYLSTGLDNLDNAFREDGLPPGTLVTLLASPHSVGDFLTYNMAGGRPTYYVAGSRGEETITDLVTRAGGITENELEVFSVPTETPLNKTAEFVSGVETNRPPTVIVEPANALEPAPTMRYRQFLRILRTQVRRTNGLGVMLCLEDDTNPESRSLSVHMSDTVLRLIHNSTTDGVDDYLSVEKTHPDQRLVDQEMRVFQAKQELDMDVETVRNITP
jgi:hypothetical protein